MRRNSGAVPRQRLTQSEQASVLIWALFSVLTLFFVVYPGMQISAAIRAAAAKGVQGFWTATGQRGGSRGLFWVGAFKLSNGKVLLANVEYLGNLSSVRMGTTVPALYSGGTPAFVYPRHGYDWKAELFTVIGAAILFLAIQVYFALAVRRRHRRLRTMLAPPLGDG
jgi:hypothetical protein